MSSSQSFPKSLRLLASGDYTRVLRKATVNVARGPLRMRAIENRMSAARLGLVVTKKGNRLAVRRNRIKRIIREQFRLRCDELPQADIVFQVFAAVDDNRLANDVNRLLDRLDELDGD